MPQEKKLSGVVRELVSERHDTKENECSAISAANDGWVKGCQGMKCSGRVSKFWGNAGLVEQQPTFCDT